MSAVVLAGRLYPPSCVASHAHRPMIHAGGVSRIVSRTTASVYLQTEWRTLDADIDQMRKKSSVWSQFVIHLCCCLECETRNNDPSRVASFSRPRASSDPQVFQEMGCVGVIQVEESWKICMPDQRDVRYLKVGQGRGISSSQTCGPDIQIR
jgi:hypothetical protein